MPGQFTESIVEAATLQWLEGLGYNGFDYSKFFNGTPTERLSVIPAAINHSILSDEFLEDVRGLPYRNLALEVLRKLINDEIKTRSRKNLVQSRSFASMLETTIKRWIGQLEG